ncbi:hypothetical protein [Bacillus sp. 179-C3.3 HS]|uniref:hypothetical protein n=1 Tax=Bacillus sp. 179-C3.3 HS TaxID=3232162 RepID=UPI0039A20406
MKREEGFIYPHILATILFFLLILGSMTIGLQKELASAELTISFYKKHHLLRMGLREAVSKTKRLCDQQNVDIDTEDGRVTLNSIVCDQKKLHIRMLVKVTTKDGVADQRELVLDWNTGAVIKWTLPE